MSQAPPPASDGLAGLDDPDTTGDLDGEPADTKGPIGRLLDGSAPGPTVSSLEADYDLAKHWAITLRGLVRAAVGDGVPPIGEILVGLVMAVIAAGQDDGEGDLGVEQAGEAVEREGQQ